MKTKNILIGLLIIILLSTFVVAEYVTIPGKTFNFSVDKVTKKIPTYTLHGGGGGGGSGYRRCDALPNCTEWTNCTNGTESKECYDECNGNYTVEMSCKNISSVVIIENTKASTGNNTTEKEKSVPLELPNPATKETPSIKEDPVKESSYWWVVIPIILFIVLLIFGIRAIKKMFDKEQVDEFGYKEEKDEIIDVKKEEVNNDVEEQIQKELEGLDDL